MEGEGGAECTAEQYAARATSLASGIRIIESGERRERERVSCQEIGAISGEWPGMWVKR